MEYGAGVSDSETKLAGDDVVASRPHLEVCRGVTLTSDSLSSTSSSSPSSRYHSAQTSGRQDQAKHVQTPAVLDEKVLDMSVESEVPLDVGYTVRREHSRWEDVEKDRDNDVDDSIADDVSLSEYKTVVDLSTSKTFSTDVDDKTSERRCLVSSDSDLDDVPDTASQRSSLLSSTVVFSQPLSLVHN